jgi:hypothetical protein
LKRLYPLTVVLVLAWSLGCDASDPNQHLKPIDPRTPRPKPTLEGHGLGAKWASDRPAPVLK